MPNTKQLLENLIKQLYKDASYKYKLKFSKFDTNYIIKAHDGTFLGNCGSRFDSDSIFNRFSDYGSRFSDLSIFNKFGTYGSKYENFSPYNKYTNTPPKVFLPDGSFVGHLSANKYVENPIDPNAFVIKGLSDMNIPVRAETHIRSY